MTRIIPLLLIALLVFPGCQKKTADNAPPVTLSEAEQRFVTICRNQHKLNVSVFEAGKTVWIYLPMEEDLVDYHGAHKNDVPRQKKQFIISTLEGDAKDDAYRFMFDITDGI